MTRTAFEELGFPNPVEHSAKADLVISMSKIIKWKKITQTEAAKIIGLSQPKLSELLSGSYRSYTIDRLIRYLDLLGYEAQITVREKIAA